MMLVFKLGCRGFVSMFKHQVQPLYTLKEDMVVLNREFERLETIVEEGKQRRIGDFRMCYLADELSEAGGMFSKIAKAIDEENMKTWSPST